MTTIQSYLGSHHSHDHVHTRDHHTYKVTLDHIIVMTMPTHVATIQIYLGSYHNHDHAHTCDNHTVTLDHIIVMTMPTCDNHTNLSWIISVMTMPTHVTTIQIYLGSHHSHDHFHTRDHHTYKVTLDPIPRAVCHRHRFKVNSC